MTVPARVAVVMALSIGFWSSVFAQTFQDAVRANLLLGLDRCLVQTTQHQAVFGAAGFVHSIDRASSVETVHRYGAPGGTVAVLVTEGQAAGDCAVETPHMTLGEAIPLVDAYLKQHHPGRFVHPGGAPAPCRSFEDRSRAIPFVVYLGNGQHDGCATQGPVRITIFSAV